MRRVAVLLSTYNGEKYLREQMASLLEQAGVEITLFVRDDGSKDASVDVVSSFMGGNVPIMIEKGPNVGVIRSFFTLLGQAGDDFDYYAFCDQDDFWERDKLISAVQALEESGIGPRLYCSAVGYADVELEPIGMSRIATVPSFGNALVENVVVGCTAVFDRGLRQLLVEYLPRHALMHDWWAYLVASAFGTVIFDSVPHIRYRQHGGNVVGGDARSWVMWGRRLRRFVFTRDAVMSIQAEEFHRIFGGRLALEQKKLLEQLLAARRSILSRVGLFFSAALRRQSIIDTLVIKILVLMGRY